MPKSHFQWNIEFLDSGLYFNCFFDLKMVPKLTCGSLWGSQGRQHGVLRAGLDFVDFFDSGDPQELRGHGQMGGTRLSGEVW